MCSVAHRANSPIIEQHYSCHDRQVMLMLILLPGCDLDVLFDRNRNDKRTMNIVNLRGAAD